MRRRATFVHDPEIEFDPAEIQLKGRKLLHPGLRAAREERLTFGFDELSPELIDVLRHSHELHIKWISNVPYNVSVPYLSASTGGLHVHYTPLEQHQNDLLCPMLREVFSKELKCKSTESTFTQPSLISERFASSASLQYYSVLPQLTQLVAYVQRKICPQSDVMCFHRASLLSAADYVDIDYDSISHALVLTAFWSKPLENYYDPIGQLIFEHQWPLDIRAKENDKVEVGILSSSQATEPHEIQLEGILTVVAEDETPKPTMFSFPSRHHTLLSAQSTNQGYTVSFVRPTGLHPTLKISFPSASALQPPTNAPVGTTCSLHTYLTLPSTIFADQYAFPTTIADPLFEEAHHIHFLRGISGELDLEAPDYVIDKWGSTMLLELSTPSSSSSSSSSPSSPPPRQKEWEVSIPLHLRYLPPSNTLSHRTISLPWPIVFWACTAEEGTKFPVNPFDRVNLGYDALFGPRTMFYHLTPRPAQDGSQASLTEKIDVSVLNTSRVGGNDVVQWGTLVIVVLGFAWIVFKLGPAFAVSLSSNSNSKSSTDSNAHTTSNKRKLRQKENKKKQ